MDLPHDVELYVGLRQIGSLPDVDVPAYFEADVRLSWHVDAQSRDLARRREPRARAPRRGEPAADPRHSAQRLPGRCGGVSDSSAASAAGALRRARRSARTRRLLAALAAGAACAQGIALEQAVKATYLYKIAAFVEWPAGAFDVADEPARDLRRAERIPSAAVVEAAVAGQRANGREFEVRRIAAGAHGRGLPYPLRRRCRAPGRRRAGGGARNARC